MMEKMLFSNSFESSKIFKFIPHDFVLRPRKKPCCVRIDFSGNQLEIDTVVVSVSLLCMC